MSIKNWSTNAASNTSLPPDGAPESSTKFKDWNDIMRQVMAKVRCLAAPVTIASAATTDLGASDETIQTISGVTTITSFGTVSAGIYKFVTFSGALTLTHNATSLILLTGANRTTVAGDCGLYVSLGGGNWKEYFYSSYGTPASYQPLDATLTALASALTAANKIPYATAPDTLGELTLDTDGTLASNSDVRLATQKAVKTYVDARPSKILQVVSVYTGELANGTTTIPLSDAIPQQTQGDQYMSLAITPTSVTSKLRVDVVIHLAPSTPVWVIAAIFRDATADAIGTSFAFQATSGGGTLLSFSAEVVAGSTAATTFKVRAGPHSAATLTFNGNSGGRYFGGKCASSIRITEIAA